KEKTMAALRNGIKTVLIPADNEKDLEEIDQTVRAALHFVLVDSGDKALAEALRLDPVQAECPVADLPPDCKHTVRSLNLKQ
ncbi:MAG: S16 family serine protease, partial [Pseudoflavonifractor sp.]